MKYNENNKPIICMMTQSTCYRQTKTMDVKGILWHSTGADNPWLKRYVQPDDKAAEKEDLIKLIGKNSYGNDWNHQTVQAGLNCWIGKLSDGTVATVQTMPWNFRPWGCGSGAKGSCNTGWIQFEICEDGLNDADYFGKVYKEACELTAYLCKMFGIDPKGSVSYNGVKIPTILCHADSYKLGLGSNHGDVLHWFPNFGKNMDTARNDVAALLQDTAENSGTTIPDTNKPAETSQLYRVRKTWSDSRMQKGAYKILTNAMKCADQNPGYSVFDSEGVKVYETGMKNVFTPYIIQVDIPDLNIRSGPGVGYQRTGLFTGKGRFTIVDEKDGWGKLKSGAGWICLKYTSRT